MRVVQGLALAWLAVCGLTLTPALLGRPIVRA